MCYFKKEGSTSWNPSFLKICYYLITVTSPFIMFGLPFGIFL